MWAGNFKLGTKCGTEFKDEGAEVRECQTVW